MALTPDYDQGADNDDCEIVIYPPMVDGVLLNLLRQLYSDPEYHFSPYIAGLLRKHGHWQEGNPSTIVIEEWMKFDPAAMEARPGIFVRDLSLQRQPVGLSGDQYSEDLSTGITSHWNFWRGSVMAMHVANNTTEAKFLAWQSAKSLTEISKVVTTQTSLGEFSVAQVGEARPLKESQKHFAAPVVLNYTCPHSWDLQPDLPRLKFVGFEVDGGIR